MVRVFALKLSGKVFDDEKLVNSYVALIRDLALSGYRLAVVAGGGSLARRYIALAEALGASRFDADRLGILVSRLNAALLASSLGGLAYPDVPGTVDELVRAWSSGVRVVVVGGFQPGQSTATVAALVAEAIRADVLVNAGWVDAVYDDDPRTNPSARRITEIAASELEALLKSRALPGTYELFDPWSLAILRRSNIPMYVVDARDPNNVTRVLMGENPGTLVKPM